MNNDIEFTDPQWDSIMNDLVSKSGTPTDSINVDRESFNELLSYFTVIDSGVITISDLSLTDLGLHKANKLVVEYKQDVMGGL